MGNHVAIIVLFFLLFFNIFVYSVGIFNMSKCAYTFC